MRANHLRERFQTNRGLSHSEKFYLRPWFKSTVDKVRVMWEVPLNDEIRVGGQTLAVSADAQTFGYNIYFRERRDTGNAKQLIALAHEMLHVWQYEKLNRSTQKYCRFYMNGYFRNDLDYYNIPMERSAYDFEYKFAQWLGRNHPNPHSSTRTFRTSSPYQQRTAPIPRRLVIPDQEYAVTCLENRTNNNITYRYKWGNNDWSSTSVNANSSKWHSMPYEGGVTSSPDLRIQFDYDLSNGIQNKTYKLDRYRTTEQSCRNARKYYFRVDNNQLDVKDPNR